MLIIQPSTRVRDFLHLLPANLREMKSKKLLPRYVGPYPIEEVITPNVYRIGFPPSILVHDKVNKKNLKPYLSSTSNAPLDHLPSFLSKEIKLERQESIETIVDYKLKQGQKYYLVKWKHRPIHENTWLSESEFPARHTQLLRNFEACLAYFECYINGEIASEGGGVTNIPIVAPPAVPNTENIGEQDKEERNERRPSRRRAEMKKN